MRITQAQAQALASFVWRIREDWDHPGIVAAITKAAPLGTPADIGTALCRLAANGELRTPAILADPGTHWADTTVAKRTPPVMCPVDGHGGEKAAACSKCAALSVPPPADWRPAPTRTPRTHTHPTPERPSLDATRARADEEQK